jgi:hypothetical protein
MPIESSRADAGDAMRQRGLRIVLAWMLLTVLQAAMKLYVIQEIFSVLLATAVATVGLMLVPVTFVLLQSGARRALPWLKTSVARLGVSIYAIRMGRLRARL